MFQRPNSSAEEQVEDIYVNNLQPKLKELEDLFNSLPEEDGKKSLIFSVIQTPREERGIRTHVAIVGTSDAIFNAFVNLFKEDPRLMEDVQHAINEIVDGNV